MRHFVSLGRRGKNKLATRGNEPAYEFQKGGEGPLGGRENQLVRAWAGWLRKRPISVDDKGGEKRDVKKEKKNKGIQRSLREKPVPTNENTSQKIRPM